MLVFNISFRILSGSGAFLDLSVFTVFTISLIEIGLSNGLWMSFVSSKMEMYSFKDIEEEERSRSEYKSLK